MALHFLDALTATGDAPDSNVELTVTSRTLMEFGQHSPFSFVITSDWGVKVGGNIGGIFDIFLPENIVLEPGQNVLRGSGQSGLSAL